MNQAMSDDILVKYLAGEASEQEQTDVQLWLKNNPANKKYFYDFKLIWNLSKHNSPTSFINEDEAWARFKQRIDDAKPISKSRTFARPYNWIKIAAILLLIVGSGTWFYNSYWVGKNIEPPIVVLPKPINNSPIVTTPKTETINDTNTKSEQEIPDANDVVTVQKTSRVIASKDVKIKQSVIERDPGKGYICNNTPCPIQICINQTMKCPNNKPAAITTYSTLQPDQQGELDYKANNKIAKNCSLTIKDIEIKSIATGEMIILNENSSPATAQELFSYITRQKKGDILAGSFHKDCNNQVGEHGLVFDSQEGNWVMQ